MQERKEGDVGEEPFYAAAEHLEQVLGDPSASDQPRPSDGQVDKPGWPPPLSSFKEFVELDEREEFPTTFCHALDTWGLQEYYVPAQYGGKLRRFDEVFTLGRSVARRDLSAAIAHSKTLLGSTPVWIAGTHEQREMLSRRIRNRESIALALTEEAHGGDLAATECLASKTHDHYLLSGTKWLINNATRSSALCVLARTHAHSDSPLGVSLFLVEKEKLDPTSFHHLPKFKTHGVRGMDMSGISFEQSMVSKDALIGKEHHGLAPIFKTFQVTRPLTSALSLGAADTALRLALTFALERRIYRDTVFALPVARTQLVNAFTDLLICDCMALFAARALHVIPNQMSLWSSVTKYFVPTLLENMVRDSATILGARYYLREHYASGMFQKIVRDIALVSLFDGSTQVNLSLIASQLGQIAHNKQVTGTQANNRHDEATAVSSRIKQTCTLEEPLPEFDGEKLVLTNRGRDDLQLSLLLVAEQYNIQPGDGDDEAFASDLKLLMHRFIQERQTLDQAVRNLVAGQGDISVSVEGFELAKMHCILHAASACYYMWLHNRSTLDDRFASGDWLVLCLIRLLKMLSPRENLISPVPYVERVATAMVRLLQEGRMFSIVPIQLATACPEE
jgi:alkylation response protein AidB-like acyl-CoA dehydrogenase